MGSGPILNHLRVNLRYSDVVYCFADTIRDIKALKPPTATDSPLPHIDLKAVVVGLGNFCWCGMVIYMSFLASSADDRC